MRINPLLLFVVPLLTTIAVYAIGLNGPLLYDDYTALGGLLRAEADPATWGNYVVSNTGPLGRPVSMLSFLANLSLSGADLFYWKLTNLFIHCAIGCLIWSVVYRLAADQSRRSAYFIALTCASIWLLHPLHVSTVLYTVQRMTQLSALFCIAGLFLYIVGRQRQLLGRRANGCILAAFFIAIPLAALSKEIGLLLPVYFAIVEWTMFHGRSSSAERKRLMVLFFFFLIVPAVIGMSYYGINFDRLIAESNLDRGFAWNERLLTESRIVIEYLSFMLFPDIGRMGFYHDTIRISHGFFLPSSTAISILTLTGLFVLGLFLRSCAPLASCGLFIFFAGHLLESTFMPLALMFEHRNYFPSIGIFIALAALLSSVFVKMHRARIIVVFIVLAVLASLTQLRSADWSDEVRLTTTLYQANPVSPAAAAQFAELLRSNNRTDAALAVLQPLGQSGARLQRLQLLCLRDGSLNNDAFFDLDINAATVLSSYALTGLVEIANLGLDGVCEFDHESFLQILKGAASARISLSKGRYTMTMYRAHFQRKLGMDMAAYASLEAVHQLAFSVPTPLLLSAEWLIEDGRIVDAVAMIDRAKVIDANSRVDYAAVIDRVADKIRLAPAL